MSVAIVAIPEENDYVWKTSSEKIPHMTLLFLGDVTDQDTLIQITNFVQHVADTTLPRFGASVDHRGVLGPDEADVVFFRPSSVKNVAQVRSFLLEDTAILKAFSSITQYPQWMPHLTLGYPATPAHEDTRDYPGISYVQFDRLALWTGGFEGPTFLLKDRWEEMETIAMSDIDSTKRTFEETLAHHGIKGQKWGVRRSARQLSGASEDATNAHAARQKAKAGGGTHVLTNKELQDLTTRLNLEQQFSRLSSTNENKSFGKKGGKFAGEILGQVGKNVAKELLSEVAKTHIKRSKVGRRAGLKAN